MNPQYYVRAAPRQPGPQTTFNAFTIRTAPGELFDRAHLILIAETVKPSRTTGDNEANAREQAAASRRAVATIREIMQHEVALPVVRRLVEALRQTNLVLHTEQQGVRLITGLLIKNTLYLSCIGNASAYLIRHNEVKLLLRAERTRDRYLGHSRQFWLDYQLQSAPSFFADETLPHAYLLSDRFILAPGDTLVLCAAEITLEQIKPTLIYAQQPEKLANSLAKIMARQLAGQEIGQAAGIIALHWKVNRVSSVVQQLMVVLVIFFCMTFAMQAVSQLNGKLDSWMVASGATNATRQPAPMIYWATPSAQSSLPASVATDTTASQSTVKVNVNVNVSVDATAEATVDATVDAVPLPLGNAVAFAVSPTPIDPTPEPTLPWPTNTPAPTVLSTVVQPTSTSTSFPTMAPLPPTATPAPLILTVTPLPPTAMPTETPLPKATLLPPPAVVAVYTDSVGDPVLPSPTVPPASLPAITLLAPADQTSSDTQMTFVWQSDHALPPGHAYELIVWQEGQLPGRDGLGIAAPLQEQSLTVQLAGLYATGVIQPGLYTWGVLLVTVDPYTRVDLLAGGQTVRFETTHSSSDCDPDRQNC